MKTILTCIVLLCFMFAPLRAQNYVSPSFRVLQSKTTVDWQEITFYEFVAWMLDDVGWNVVVRWDALSSEGVDSDTLITMRLREVPVYVIVDEVLQQLSSDITYHLTEHAMTISSRADFNKDMYVRAYDLTDLVVQFTPLDEPPATDLRAMSTGGASVGVSSFGDEFQENNQEPMEEIKLNIENTLKVLKPSTWQEFGGKGTMSWVGNILIIRNIIEVHELIALY